MPADREAPRDAYRSQPSTRDWGSPDGKTLRPGVNVNDYCTGGFLFHLDDERYFFATAGHCFLNVGITTSVSPCPATLPVGTEVTLRTTDNQEVIGSLAYVSYGTMAEVGEEDETTCTYNDFALVEVPPEAFPRLHPAALGHGGPTRLAESEENLTAGQPVYGYANSDLRPTWLLHGEGFPTEGMFDRYAHDGWQVRAFFMLPLLVLQGDSGGYLVGPDGQALGVLCCTSAPLWGSWTNLPRALDYMYVHEGWAPSLVTWDRFEPTMVP